MTSTATGVARPQVEDLATYQELHALLGRFSYKPGWVFRAIAPVTEWEPGRLTIEHTAPDARKPWAGLVTVHAELRLPRGVTGQDLRAWLWAMVLGVEEHEAGEWFVLNGTRPFDPHRAEGH